ncbi:MAG: hypothetical protein R6V59_03405 [Dehalococcoidia bacterium]
MGCLMAFPLAAIAAVMGLVMSTLMALFIGVTTVMTNSMAAFIAFLLILI